MLGRDPCLLLCPALPNIPTPMSLACNPNPILTPKAKSAAQPGFAWCSKEHSLEGSYLLPLGMPGVIIWAAQELQHLCQGQRLV